MPNFSTDEGKFCKSTHLLIYGAGTYLYNGTTPKITDIITFHTNNTLVTGIF